MRANRIEKNDPNSIMKLEHEIRSGNSIKMMITIKIRITSKVAIMIKITSKTAQERNYAEFCKICAAPPFPNLSSEDRKCTPGGSKINPRGVQNRAKIAQGRSRSPQERPRAAQELPKRRPRALRERPKTPKNVQERPKSGPRAAQERPKSAQEGPKMTLKASGGAFGDHFDTHKLEKRPFGDRSVARLARKARAVNFFIEFRSVRAGANM